MKIPIWLYLVVACSYVLFMSVGAILLRMDFSNSDFSGSDMIHMFPVSTWFFLALLPLGILLIWKLDKRFSVIIPFTLTILLLVAFELVQYPSVFFWDTFWHSATAKYVINNGSFPGNIGLYDYPGTFFISAALSEVLGLPVLLTDLFLAALFNFLLVFLLFVIGRIFGGTEHVRMEMSWLVPTIYLVFSFRLYNGNHFSPQLLGLCVYVFFVYVCLKMFFLRARGYRILALILAAALTTIHLFSALFAVTTLLCIYAVGGRLRPLKLNGKQFVTLPILVIAIVLLVSWHVFVTTEPLTEAVNFLSSVLRGERTLSGFTETIVLGRTAGSFTPLLSFYRYGIYTLFAFASAIALLIFRRKAKVKLIFLMGIGIMLGGMAVYLSPATFGVGRVLFYGGVVIAILISYLIAKGHVKSLTFKRGAGLLKIVLPFLVIGTFLVSNLYYSTYVSFVHQDEVQMLQFDVRNVRKQISIDIDEFYVVRFYMNMSLPMIVIDEKSDNSTIAQMKIEESDLSLQYLPRQIYYFNLTFIQNQNSLVYSNGLGRIYAKTSSTVGS